MSERIISLTSENIKRLRAISITPNGSSVEIAGQNGQGKSSVLDSIWYALAGRSVLPDRPIRDGESRAETVVELSNYTVSRTFTAAGGGTLKVTPKTSPGDGKPIPSPQAFLDGLLSALTFDPFEFTRISEFNQGETLRKLLGLDFSSDDARQKQAYDHRTEVNRSIEHAAVKLKDWPIHQGLDEAVPVSISDVMVARASAAAKNNENREKLDKLALLQSTFQRLKHEVENAHREILELERHLESKKANNEVRIRAAEEALKASQEFGASIMELKDIDLRTFDEQILKADEHNAKLKQNRERAELLSLKRSLESKAAGLTETIAAVDEAKSKALAEAKFPLPGLAFSATGGVMFNGVPFAQISTAEQIRISAAIGLALNPGLSVMFIRNGSLIDEAGLKLLVQLAESHDAQLWIERVGALSGELPGVVIEDGGVVQSTLDKTSEKQ